ncbi:MAG: Dabb family protein [Bacteroides sp.]
MLKHVVMWRFVEGAEGKSRSEHAQWMKEHLEALVGVVPEIRALEVGIDCNKGAAAYDAVLIALFDDAEALKRYKNHPAHQAISNHCKQVRESRTVVDYEE